MDAKSFLSGMIPGVVIGLLLMHYTRKKSLPKFILLHVDVIAGRKYAILYIKDLGKTISVYRDGEAVEAGDYKIMYQDEGFIQITKAGKPVQTIADTERRLDYHIK